MTPMPDVPPCTKNRSPPFRPPRITMFDQTVKAPSGRQAASFRLSPAGIGSAWVAAQAAYSAYPPPGSSAQTLSPIAQRVTPGPQATTVPDPSSPGRGEAPCGGA